MLFAIVQTINIQTQFVLFRIRPVLDEGDISELIYM